MMLTIPSPSAMTLTDRLINAAGDFKERPWGNINYKLNETFDAVGSTVFFHHSTD